MSSTGHGNDVMELRKRSRTIPTCSLLLVAASMAMAATARAQTPNQVGRILAGLPVEDAVLEPLYRDRIERYMEDVSEDWARFERNLGQEMLAWSASVLEHETGETVFYPFAGPDFSTVRRLYPRAGRYVLVALQTAGRIPSLDTDRGHLRDILNLFDLATGNFSVLGFFLTDDMNEQFDQQLAPVDGITGLLLAMAAREGFHVAAVEPIRLDPNGGDVELHPGDRSELDTWRSVRLTLRAEGDREVLVDYLQLDLSDQNLRRDEVARRWVESMSSNRVFLKAASHLMQNFGFNIIRDAILENAISVLQDESGIDYEPLDEHFEVRLFGNFTAVNDTFHEYYQRSLAQAYIERRDELEDLPFRIGYRKPSGYCLQYAHTRRPQAPASP
jgi:hypothetical protein